MNILVAEDDLTSRIIMLGLLHKFGRVDTAGNGQEALMLFNAALEREDPYQLVCLDIMMPHMDGREALRAIRESESQRSISGLDGARIIMTTALDDSKNILGAFKEMCDGYLVKPIDRKQLVNLLNKLKLIPPQPADPAS